MEDEVKNVIPNVYACHYNGTPHPRPTGPHVNKEGTHVNKQTKKEAKQQQKQKAELNTDMPTKKETPWYQDK